MDNTQRAVYARWPGIFSLVAVVALVLSHTSASAACSPYYGLGFIQSGHGTPGNFEVVAPASAGGLVHYWRDNSSTKWSVPWSAPQPFGSGNVDGAALIQSNFTTNGIGHLEVVATVGSTLVTYWRDDGGTQAWNGPTTIGSGVRGTPGFVQSRHGTKGNFEVVVPAATGGLVHYWRDNDAAGSPWSAPTAFGHRSSLYDAVALIQSNYGSGNLELIARTGSSLHHYWRDDGTTWAWHGPTVVASGVRGTPSFMQSNHGTQGNFEVVTPKLSGGMAHYWRDNDQASPPWNGPYAILGFPGKVSAVSIIQSNYGHLEWVARTDSGELYWGWRDDGASWDWHGPYAFSAQPCCTAATHGTWDDAISAGMVGIHAALLHTGDVLFFAFTNDSDHIGISRVLNPNTGELTSPTFTTPSHPNVFCAGQAAMPDGRILVSGGHHDDINKLHIFDPTTKNWSFAGLLNDKRWYPTTTTLANGKVFIISGSNGPIGDDPDKVNNTWQTYDPASATLSPAYSVTPSPFSGDGFDAVDLYPFVYMLPDNRLLVHSRNSTRFLNPETGEWASTRYDTKSPNSRQYPRQGSSVLLPLLPPAYHARVLVLGGAGSIAATVDTPATNSVEMLHLGKKSPAWAYRKPMHYARVMPDAVLLPNRQVFVVGGSASGKADEGTAPVLTPELYNPDTNKWTKLCPMRVPRIYHSSALLLPDARVLVAGKDGLFNLPPYKYPEERVEIYSPPYLFAGTRPTITRAPSTLAYGTTFSVDVGALPASSIGSVALIRNGLTTHSFNMDQRYVGLRISATSGPTLTLQAPPRTAVAPPGYYMLFVMTWDGVPSVAAMVQMGSE